MKSWTSGYLLVCFAFLATCVSVDIKKEDIERDENIQFQSPPSPYTEVDSETVDHSWRNPSNGNSISFFSECDPDTDPQLELIFKGLLRDIDSHEVTKKDPIKYNRRRSLRATVQGEIDGVQSKFEVLILKKNSCIYILSYVALENTYDTDLKAFEDFLKEFKVP